MSQKVVRLPGSQDFVEALERVLGNGIMIEAGGTRDEVLGMSGETSTWLCISAGDIEILTIEARLSWHSLNESKE